MASTGGLVQRRNRQQAGVEEAQAAGSGADCFQVASAASHGASADSPGSGEEYARIRRYLDEADENDDGEKGDKMGRLTLLEEVLLLGIKDTQVRAAGLAAACR